MRRNRKLELAVAATAAATLVLGTAVEAAAASAPATPSGARSLSAAAAAALSQNVNTPVIVLLRNQPKAAPRNSAAARTRADAIASAQAPLLSELGQVHATHVHKYQLTNAVSATVSKAEAARLASNPNVAAVLPDSLVRGGALPTTGTKSASTKATSTTDPTAQDVPGECGPNGQTQLEPEALSVTHTDSDGSNAQTAHGLGITGAGVKVAFLADGIDINNPDFIRADGSHVFADYQDFTGDGVNAPTPGAEAFIDASAIAAQGRQVYNVQNWGAHPTTAACNIRVLGVAPGAQLYGYKVFGQTNYSTMSALVAAADYAVNTDHVDVINESFGYNPFPDNGSEDLMKQVNDAAVASGVTVSVATGDGGTAGTQSSPSTDPNVLSVGASTTLRFNVQTDYAAARNFPITGWLDDNVSPLSSSGFNQGGTGIDLIAPGDQSFALCTPNTSVYESCADFNGNPSTLERSSGTSESAPLVSGAAALVIQAYRQAHGGASPTPALVKQVLTSTADDLTAPGDEQGAGRLNTYKAVQAAESVQDGNGSPAETGTTLLVDQSQLDGTGAPGSQQQWLLNVTNTGANEQTVYLSGRTFGAPANQTTGQVTLSDTTSPHFTDWGGHANNYGTVTFNVPANADRLDASIAWQAPANANNNSRVRLILIDPQGRYAAHSVPQAAFGNHGHLDVRFPAAGQWTAIIFSQSSARGGTTGTVQFAENTSNTTSFGTVSPSVLDLSPGQTGTVTVLANTPATPGDASGSVVLNEGGATGQTSVPVILRSLVNANGGTFTGTLTGGDGRSSDIGQASFYQFDVPSGQHSLSASVDLSSDAGDNVWAELVDPNGELVASGSNQLTTAYNPTTRAGTQQSILPTDLYARNPQAGRWTLVVNFAGEIVGDQLSQTFHGSIGLNKVDVHATGLPTSSSTTLPAGKAVTIPVTVHNTGTAPEDFFVDPRLNSLTTLNLAATQPATVALPMPGSAASPAWLVPSETQGVAVTGTASQPATFDFGPEAGDPDTAAQVTGTSPEGAIFESPLPSGVWGADPSELGATPSTGAPAGTITLNTAALTKAFDPAVSSPATDLWQSSVTPATALNLVTVQPGQTATIPVTITPSGTKGSVVCGTLYVDNLVVGNTPVTAALNFADAAPTQPNANELVGIPYQYTIG